jgi:hypothetical protein
LAARIYQVFGRLLEERRREPRDDLMTELVEEEIDGERLSEDDLLGFCFLLLVGGNVPTPGTRGVSYPPRNLILPWTPTRSSATSPPSSRPTSTVTADSWPRTRKPPSAW